MVEVVVLDVPGLGQHPVKPLARALRERPQGKPLGVEETRGIGVVVAAVARVVSDGRPAAEGPQAQGHNGDRVGPHPHGLCTARRPPRDQSQRCFGLDFRGTRPS